MIRQERGRRRQRKSRAGLEGTLDVALVIELDHELARRGLVRQYMVVRDEQARRDHEAGADALAVAGGDAGDGTRRTHATFEEHHIDEVDGLAPDLLLAGRRRHTQGLVVGDARAALQHGGAPGRLGFGIAGPAGGDIRKRLADALDVLMDALAGGVCDRCGSCHDLFLLVGLSACVAGVDLRLLYSASKRQFHPQFGGRMRLVFDGQTRLPPARVCMDFGSNPAARQLRLEPILNA